MPSNPQQAVSSSCTELYIENLGKSKVLQILPHPTRKVHVQCANLCGSHAQAPVYCYHFPSGDAS